MKLTTPSQKTRAYIYRGLVATAPLAVVYGLASGTEVAVWLGAAGAWLGVGLAAKNTSVEE